MAVVSAAWGIPVAVTVQARVMASNCLPSNDHSFPFALSPPAQWQHNALQLGTQETDADTQSKLRFRMLEKLFREGTQRVRFRQFYQLAIGQPRAIRRFRSEGPNRRRGTAASRVEGAAS
jgi:hypothetical protein